MISIRRPRLERKAALTLALVFLALAMSAPGSQPDFAAASTGKIPLEGALTASNLTPKPGAVVFLYFNATPLIVPADLNLEITLPEGVELLGGDLKKTVHIDKAAESAGMTLTVRIVTTGEKHIFGAAALRQNADSVLSRAFALTLRQS